MYSEEAVDKKIHVLSLDSSAFHTQLLSDALRRDEALEVFSLDSVNAVMNASIDPAVDVLVLSANLEDQPYRGFEVLRALRSARPGIRAVLLLDSSKPEVVLDAFRAGAKGVFGRHDSIDKLSKCIQCVHRGQIWANSRELSIALEALASGPLVHAVGANGLCLLSKRELEIVQRLAEGLTNREIAECLKLSPHTVKNYLFRIFDKLGVSSRVELLFLTLSRETHSQSVLDCLLNNCPDGVLQTSSKLADYEQAAEQGSPIAQLALGQFYLTRRADSRDLIEAYKWYLVAAQQILRTSKGLSKKMTAEQLLQAEKMAAKSFSPQPKPSLTSLAPVSTKPRPRRPVAAAG